MQNAKEVDMYIAQFPVEVRQRLEEIRAIIQKAAPGTEEIISYKMPAYRQNGVLVYFAGYKNHIGFYPTGSGIAAFEAELGAYTYSKGAIQFPIDKKIPAALVQRIVKFRIKQDAEKKTARKK